MCIQGWIISISNKKDRKNVLSEILIYFVNSYQSSLNKQHALLNLHYHCTKANNKLINNNIHDQFHTPSIC